MKIIVLVSTLLFLNVSFAAGTLPVCKDGKTIIKNINNSLVVSWRQSAPNKFLGRAFIQGKIVGVVENRQGHIHLEVDLDGDLQTKNDRIEVVYNTQFGEVPDFRNGDELIACGDFVKDSWSPMGAVVHWVHINTNSNKNGHEDGFLYINGTLTGTSYNRY